MLNRSVEAKASPPATPARLAWTPASSARPALRPDQAWRPDSGPGPRSTRWGWAWAWLVAFRVTPTPCWPGRCRPRRSTGRRPSRSCRPAARPVGIRPRTKSPFLRSRARSTGGGAPILAAQDLAQIDRSSPARRGSRRSAPGCRPRPRCRSPCAGRSRSIRPTAPTVRVGGMGDAGGLVVKAAVAARPG